MSTAATPEAAAQLLFPPNVQYNNSRLYTVKFLSSCFAGAVAGVLGLENTLGFALFVFSTLLTSSCLYLKCKGRPAKFVPGGWWELVNPGQENTFSFVLVWTLFYGWAADALAFFRGLSAFGAASGRGCDRHGDLEEEMHRIRRTAGRLYLRDNARNVLTVNPIWVAWVAGLT
ncbi:hypothetical protein K466DRAFT_593198 [Polyporus arcularius HHB13444]|uniref:ER membrane protein complex subunit 6 n=1 Tax=Polyporus arcularius HHB13444 TaxID=1314778 RepID=A0A5C3PYI0_9APHY|nr:hypothetical protein K466DRAFT_593198 [Polyporus arcularius HHB13444]